MREVVKTLSAAVCCHLSPDQEPADLRGAPAALGPTSTSAVTVPPTCLRHPLVFPVSPRGCESGHLYSKSTLLCGEKHRRTQIAGASGTHFPPVEQLWPKLSCFAVGSQRNAGRTALRAPTEGKLQGSAACRNSDENTGADAEVLQPLIQLLFRHFYASRCSCTEVACLGQGRDLLVTTFTCVKCNCN